MNAFNFTRKTLPQKESLGEKLAKKRVSLGYDIKDIEKATRIRSNYLESIESGKYEKLPPDVFVRGFIKNYANFLKLDVSKVMKMYEKERGIVENMRKAMSGPPVVKPIDTPKLVVTPKTILIGSISLLALVIVSYIGWQVRILTAPPKLSISSPANNINVNSDSVSFEGKTDPGASMFINDVEIDVDQDGSFRDAISLQNGVNTLRLKAQNKLGKKTEQTRTIWATITQASQALSPQVQGVELKIDVGPNTASILVEIDGKKVTDKATVVLPGVTQTYKGNEKISITTNNAGSIRVTFNGQSIGTIGKDGEQAKRDFEKGMTIK